VLFTASGAPWVCELVQEKSARERRGFVTDGPFLFQMTGGGLLMLWSSFSEDGYAMGVSRSESGEVTGPWRHFERPIVERDGGHGMAFRDFGGGLFVVFHSPNRTPDERPVLARVEERGETIVRTDPAS
jgi:arabinan endo-1,5-alpha-L-arabinosidase